MSIIARLVSIELVSFFFQPFKFHFQSPDLFVKLCFPRSLLLQLARRATVEYHRPFGQQLFLPIANLIRVLIVLAGNFADSPVFFGRCQCDLELELTTMFSAFSGHLNSSTSQLWIIAGSTLACGLVFGGQYTMRLYLLNVSKIWMRNIFSPIEIDFLTC